MQIRSNMWTTLLNTLSPMLCLLTASHYNLPCVKPLRLQGGMRPFACATLYSYQVNQTRGVDNNECTAFNATAFNGTSEEAIDSTTNLHQLFGQSLTATNNKR